MKILVTGANRGLGLALAANAVQRGHVVLAGVRNPAQNTEKLTMLCERYPQQAAIVPLDVSSDESVRLAAEKAGDRYQALDAIVNNAGVLSERYHAIEELSMEETVRTFQINVFGPMRVVKYFLPLLRQGTRASIVNISSEAGSITNAIGGNYAYSMSKTALNMFSEQLSVALREAGIPVYAVHPGWMQTDMGGQDAAIDPYVTANGILDLIEGKKVVASRFVFIDYRGTPMVI